MSTKFAKVGEIAQRFRVSADAVYSWIRQGKIPAECVARVAGTVRVDEAEFDRQLRSGSLYQRRRKPVKKNEAEAPQRSLIAEDDITVQGRAPIAEHRWTSESGRVEEVHPFSPAMIASTE
jgi:excisionase family DNA binding protein